MGYWQPELAVGDEEIDQQHRRICVFMDDLLADAIAGHAEKRFPEAFEYLTDHFTSHFSVEEALMRKINYSGYNYHRSEHLKWFDRFVWLKANIEKHGPTPLHVRAMMEGLAFWMTYHVIGCDRLLADFVRSRESTGPT